MHRSSNMPPNFWRERIFWDGSWKRTYHNSIPSRLWRWVQTCPQLLEGEYSGIVLKRGPIIIPPWVSPLKEKGMWFINYSKLHSGYIDCEPESVWTLDSRVGGFLGSICNTFPSFQNSVTNWWRGKSHWQQTTLQGDTWLPKDSKSYMGTNR